MDDAARVRTAAREALSDVEPDRLREELDDRLDEGSVTPGVLAVLTAESLDPGADPGAVAELAAGTQLIYEGLRLTRSLTHAEPWADAVAGDVDADVEILAADVFVARGFYVLARTEAAGAAVEVVRSFGRDQTYRERAGTDRDRFDRRLEADVYELAVLAGAAPAGVEPPRDLVAYARETAREGERADEAALASVTADRVRELSGERAPSATDP